MGVSFPCPPADFDDMDKRFEAVIVRSISFGGGDVKTVLRSVSFNGRDSKPTTMKSFGSGKMIFEASLNFKGREMGTMISFKSLPSNKEEKVFVRSVSLKKKNTGHNSPTSDGLPEKKPQSPLSKPGNLRHQAAVKLQKVYKSFRTRRQLADCAVVVEQRWWKLLDFAELKRSSISFFDIEKPETALSRWSRARTRAAKVGKGLSKDEKARKLALQHWLEAIDPRHRYGHNLQFYYVKWLHCESKQPFFYWLDIGEGKEVNLDRCLRPKLQQQCIKYLGPIERKAYEVVVENGKFLYKQSGQLLDTKRESKDDKWIFVLSTSKKLYVGQKNKGTFQHSSFLAGGATLSAGRLVVEDGILKAIWPHSGHYLPTEENFQAFVLFLKEHSVDLTNVQKSPTEGEEAVLIRRNSLRSKSLDTKISTDPEATTDAKSLSQENADFRKQEPNAAELPDMSISRLSRGLCSKIARLEIPKRSEVVDILKMETLPPSPSYDAHSTDILPEEGYETAADILPEDGYETAEESFLSEEDFMVPKQTLFDEDLEEDDEEPIAKEEIMKRIHSHKGMRSYQLAQQLSSKWTTGAGPRIGCMRDYPSELQFRVLEQANLSPRPKSNNSSPRTTSRFSPKVSTPSSLRRETTAGRSLLAPEQVPLLSFR